MATSDVLYSEAVLLRPVRRFRTGSERRFLRLSVGNFWQRPGREDGSTAVVPTAVRRQFFLRRLLSDGSSFRRRLLERLQRLPDGNGPNDKDGHLQKEITQTAKSKLPARRPSSTSTVDLGALRYSPYRPRLSCKPSVVVNPSDQYETNLDCGNIHFLLAKSGDIFGNAAGKNSMSHRQNDTCTLSRWLGDAHPGSTRTMRKGRWRAPASKR